MTSMRIHHFRGRTTAIALVAVAALLPVGCSEMDRTAPPAAPEPTETAAYPSDVARAYFALALDFTKTTAGFSPPPASRAFGYLGVALYEAVVPGMPEHSTLAGILNGLGNLPQPEDGATYHWGAVANATFETLMVQLYATAPNRDAKIAAVHDPYHTTFATQADAATLARSHEWGESIANAIWAYSLADGGHEGYARNFPTSYVPPVGAGLWIPTPPAFQRALQPYWGQNRPFILPSSGNPNTSCDPGPHPPYSETIGSAFELEGREVYDTVNSIRLAGPTDVRWQIADFWADNPGPTATPAGHWISIASIVLDAEGADLGTAAETYARLGIAVSDAFISCWYTKFQLNLLRPISYIQNVGGPINDPAWLTLPPTPTPSFPEYTSGHSVQSGAAARALEAMFGTSYAFTDDTHANRNPPLPSRSFASFAAAAEEAADSRLYGGIHYRAAIDLGVQQGRLIGDLVNDIPFRR